MLASRLPFRQRHKTLLGLRYRIVDLERTGERIGRSAIEGASPLVDSVDDSIARINTRLDHVEQAKNELRELGGTLTRRASLSDNGEGRIKDDASACSASRRAMTRRHNVSSAPSKIESTRASTK